MAGLPVAGIGTIFYVVLSLGMGATKLWRWGLRSMDRLGKRETRGRRRPRTVGAEKGV